MKNSAMELFSLLPAGGTVLVSNHGTPSYGPRKIAPNDLGAIAFYGVRFFLRFLHKAANLKLDKPSQFGFD
jgi:hypothetical protein